MTTSTHEPQVERKPVTVTVTVNRKPVTFTERHATGAEIKATAIDQGVPIRQDFALFLIKEHGNIKPIRDDEKVNLKEGDEFSAVAPDDAS
jgi:Multiubiquitin